MSSSTLDSLGDKTDAIDTKLHLLGSKFFFTQDVTDFS